MKKYLYPPFLFTLFFFITACSNSTYNIVPQSHYDYPNSNVEPLGQVKAESSILTFIIPPMLSGDLEIKTVSKALAKKSGADMLINYTTETTTTTLPYIYLLKYKISGTAAKMSVGLQELK